MSKIVSFFLSAVRVVKGLFRVAKPEEKLAVRECLNNYEKYAQGNELKLKTFYDGQKDPGVSFRVFYLRVWTFDWNYGEALQATQPKHSVTVLGKVYDLQEVYDSCKNPQVSYNTFYTRVVRSQWAPLRALIVPPSR